MLTLKSSAVKKWYLAAFAGLLVACFYIVAKRDQSAGNSDDYLVSVAVGAMTTYGHSALLPGNGLNISTENPFVSSKTSTNAIVTIPYTSPTGPVISPKVNLSCDLYTHEWKAVSFADGGGATHPIDWHPN